MCRIEEKVYIGSDGSRQTFEEAFPCDKAHGRKLCSKVRRRTTEYFPKAPAPPSRDDASSPASNNPPTPTGPGSYLIERRRPSGHARQTSTHGDGARVIKPMINIEFGAKKGKGKIYPHVSVSSSKSSKRSSLGSASVGSNEVAIESPGSDASYPIRTGFPDASVPPVNPFSQSPGYTTRHAVPQSQHRHTSSASSHTTSSQPPSLYATSEPESPSGRRPARYPPTIVHNPPPGAAPSPATSRAPAHASSGRYRTTIVTPQNSSRDNVGADGLTPLDYSDFVDHSASSRASSSQAAAPEITARDADRARRRAQKEADRKRQEESDRRLAEDLAKKEEVKQVRFELGRAEEREKQRGENRLAESEKRRAEVREEARRHKKDQDERVTKKPEREKTKPPVAYTEHSKRRSRRASMTQADIDELERLRRTEEAQMARERQATEQREREEQAEELRRQQQTNDYWDPRGGNRMPIPNNAPGLGRRGSVSSGRRGSVSTTAPPMGLGRRDSTRRVSIIQPTPPPLTTSFPQQQYSTRPPSSHNNAPPLFSPGSYTPGSRPPSARHSSYHDNPFAQPPTRTSHSSQDSNPFAQPPTRNVHSSHENPFTQQPSLLHSPEAVRDLWDAREMRDALPRTTSQGDQHHTLQRRGEDVINRSGQDRSHGHRRAQQATQNMGMVVGYEDDYESSSEEENAEDKLAGYGKSLGRAGRRRHGN